MTINHSRKSRYARRRKRRMDSTTHGNIAPACPSCNTSKFNSEVTLWLRRKGYDEKSFLLRHGQVGVGLRAYFSSE